MRSSPRTPPQVEHVVLAQARMPATFADPGVTGDRESPYRFTRTLARTRHNSELLAARGARRHLAGHGGDELFHNSRPIRIPCCAADRSPRSGISGVTGR
ncbi:MAG: hypothetical protein ABIZ05_14820 [Pseudonocardiaceae bacterium]